MSEFNTIKFQCDQRVATIQFNRPQAANGLNLEMATEFADVAAACDADRTIKVVILTGSGRFFSAGGDVNAMQSSPEGPGAGVKKIANQLHRAISILARMDAPVIVAVNGTAAGAGFSTAVSGDIVIAVESAKFTMAYSNVGLSPDGGASYYLPRLIGLRKTQELMFTNRVLTAAEALEWGLVTKVVKDDELMTEAKTIASTLASGALGSHKSIKQLLLLAHGNGLESQLEIEARHIASRADSQDGIEGIAAFTEKRSAKFR